MNNLQAQIKPALVLWVLFTVLVGLTYPLTVTGLAQLLFNQQANGSLIIKDGTAVGSELIGQPFSDPAYFWGRPSATTAVPYNAAASSGSNYAASNPALVAQAQTRLDALAAAGHDISTVPVDLVTASGSGLDPHISPAAAEYQLARVASARGLSNEVVADLIIEHTKGRLFGLLGEPRINVLMLNLALDNLTD